MAAVKHLNLVSLILVLLSQVVSIIALSMRQWYVVSFTVVGLKTSQKIGLFGYETCAGTICDSGPISDIDDSGITTATYIAMSLIFLGMLLALCIGVLYFLQVTKRSVGPINQKHLTLLYPSLIALLCLFYIIIMIFYPVFFDGVSESDGGNFAQFSAHYSWSYFLVAIGNVLFVGIAFLFTLADIFIKKKSGYTPF